MTSLTVGFKEWINKKPWRQMNGTHGFLCRLVVRLGFDELRVVERMRDPSFSLDEEANRNDLPVFHQRKKVWRVDRDRNHVTRSKLDIKIAGCVVPFNDKDSMSGGDGANFVLGVRVHLLEFFQ
jgi:hypothetical protein